MLKKKAFAGAIGTGLPVEDVELTIDAPPDMVRENLERLRPLITAVRNMADTPGWRDYIKPYLEKQGNPMALVEAVKKKEDTSLLVAKIEVAQGLLNYVNSMVRSANSLAKLGAAKESEDEVEGIISI